MLFLTFSFVPCHCKYKQLNILFNNFFSKHVDTKVTIAGLWVVNYLTLSMTPLSIHSVLSTGS